MRTLLLKLGLIWCVAFAATAGLQAQDAETTAAAGSHDERIKKLLDEAELKYDIDEDGDFKLLFEYDDGRSQIVFINSQTESYQGMEIREIWAVGYVTPESTEGNEKVPSDVCENLIRANAKLKLGAWQVQTMGEKEVGVFRAMITAEASRDVVVDTLRLVGISADEKEAELLKNDEL